MFAYFVLETESLFVASRFDVSYLFGLEILNVPNIQLHLVKFEGKNIPTNITLINYAGIPCFLFSHS